MGDNKVKIEGKAERRSNESSMFSVSKNASAGYYLKLASCENLSENPFLPMVFSDGCTSVTPLCSRKQPVGSIRRPIEVEDLGQTSPPLRPT